MTKITITRLFELYFNLGRTRVFKNVKDILTENYLKLKSIKQKKFKERGLPWCSPKDCITDIIINCNSFTNEYPTVILKNLDLRSILNTHRVIFLVQL